MEIKYTRQGDYLIPNLYLEKDDADTYFGERCHTYESSSGEACMIITVKLVAIQSLDQP